MGAHVLLVEDNGGLLAFYYFGLYLEGEHFVGGKATNEMFSALRAKTFKVVLEGLASEVYIELVQSDIHLLLIIRVIHEYLRDE